MNKKFAKGAAVGILTACVGATACYKYHFRMPLKEYTGYALYMATLDDEICRNELAGNTMHGRSILFPPKAESLQNRYHLFLSMNRKKSRKAIRAEIMEMKQRLQESRQYLNEPKVDLEVSFQDNSTAQSP